MEYNWVLLCQVSSIVLRILNNLGCRCLFYNSYLNYNYHSYSNVLLAGFACVKTSTSSQYPAAALSDTGRHRHRHRHRHRRRHKERQIDIDRDTRRSMTLYEWAVVCLLITEFIYSHQSVSVCLWIIYYFIPVTSYCNILFFINYSSAFKILFWHK